jgi:hypothetical protein
MLEVSTLRAVILTCIQISSYQGLSNVLSFDTITMLQISGYQGLSNVLSLDTNNNTMNQYHMWDKKSHRIITTAATSIKRFDEQSFSSRKDSKDSTESLELFEAESLELFESEPLEILETEPTGTPEETKASDQQQKLSLSMTIDTPSQAELNSAPDPEPESPPDAENPVRHSERKRIPSFKLQSALIV